MKTWNEKDLSPKFKELETRKCTPSDLFVKEGEDQTSYGFYPPHSFATLLGDNDAQKYMCIDEPYELRGNYDDPISSNLIITFELCSLEKRSTCKSDKEISEAIEFNYLLVFENSQIYNH